MVTGIMTPGLPQATLRVRGSLGNLLVMSVTNEKTAAITRAFQ
jgi:hypothetical protein